MPPDPMQQPTNADIVSYRLDDMRKSLDTLNTAMSALSAQVMALQVSLPDRYLTRLEFAEILRQKELQQDTINKRLDTIEDRNDRQDTTLVDLQKHWDNKSTSMTSTAILAFVSLIVGLAGASLNFLKFGH